MPHIRPFCYHADEHLWHRAHNLIDSPAFRSCTSRSRPEALCIQSHTSPNLSPAPASAHESPHQHYHSTISHASTPRSLPIALQP